MHHHYSIYTASFTDVSKTRILQIIYYRFLIQKNPLMNYISPLCPSLQTKSSQTDRACNNSCIDRLTKTFYLCIIYGVSSTDDFFDHNKLHPETPKLPKLPIN